MREEGVEVNPLKDFNEAVKAWMWSRERTALRLVGYEKTASLLAKVAELQWPYRIRMTRFPLGDANQIRMRLLSGTSGLNSTLSHFRDRDPYCPWEECHDKKVKETVQHFCLDCPAYAQFRKDLKEGLSSSCTCEGEASCSNLFDSLDKDDRVLYMMSMPVGEDLREAEAKVDRHSKTYVRCAWEKRKKALKLRYNRQAPVAQDEVSQVEVSSQPLFSIFVHARAHAHAHSSLRPEFGSNGLPAKESN
jgi:hypothetical protein